jgi:hypothetical protein
MTQPLLPSVGATPALYEHLFGYQPERTTLADYMTDPTPVPFSSWKGAYDSSGHPCEHTPLSLEARSVAVSPLAIPIGSSPSSEPIELSGRRPHVRICPSDVVGAILVQEVGSACISCLSCCSSAARASASCISGMSCWHNAGYTAVGDSRVPCTLLRRTPGHRHLSHECRDLQATQSSSQPPATAPLAPQRLIPSLRIHRLFQQLKPWRLALSLVALIAAQPTQWVKLVALHRTL